MRNARTFAIAFAVIISILFLMHFALFRALVVLFDISAGWIVLTSALGILAASIIVSILIGMRFYNPLTRIYYAISLTWAGFMAYLFLASVIYLLATVIAGQQLALFGEIIFSLAVLIGIYGLIHARRVFVKEVEVTLPHLPDSWKGKRAVWISDLHIGQIYSKGAVRRIVEKVNSLSPEVVFIGGDLFDGASHPRILESIEPLRALAAPLGTYFIMGNHESYGNVELFLKSIKDKGIKVLRNEKADIAGIQLFGADYGTPFGETGIDRSTPSIILKHEPDELETSEKAGFSLQISGHTHRAQQWPFEYLARLSYGRFTYGLQKRGSMQVYTSSGAGTWGPPIRVGTNREIVLFKFK